MRKARGPRFLAVVLLSLLAARAAAATFDVTRFDDPSGAGAPGDLDIASNVTIEGDAGGGTVIDAKKAKDRAFEVLSGATLAMSNVTVKGGSTTGDGGGILNVEGSLALTDCTIT